MQSDILNYFFFLMDISFGQWDILFSLEIQKSLKVMIGHLTEIWRRLIFQKTNSLPQDQIQWQKYLSGPDV